MNENTKQLIKELEETKSLLNRLLAKKVEKLNKKNCTGLKEALESDKIETKLYNLFLNRIDPSDKEQLIKLDDKINKLTNYIEEHSGWYRTTDGFRREAHYINSGISEFASHDTYSIGRNENGYYCYEEKPSNSYYERIQEEEKSFYESFLVELKNLHMALSEKERIMNGGYRPKQVEDKDLLNNIRIYLGYKNDELKEMLEKQDSKNEQEEINNKNK